MEIYEFRYPASIAVGRRAHVGVVGSGDLEILLEPAADGQARVRVRTSVDGYGPIWKTVLDRFFSRFPAIAAIEINDFGATPAMVTLRLQQAFEESRA